jgi:hypothetical protein
MIHLLRKVLGSLLPASLAVGLAIILSMGSPTPLLAADNTACKLLTPAELEPVVGGKLSAFQAMGGDAGTGQGQIRSEICMAVAPNSTVMLRLAKGSSGSKDAAAKGIEMMRKMGVTVDVKTFGPINCSTLIPPKSMEQHGFNSTCSVVKGDQVAAVEVQTKSQKDMVSIDKLRPLAEKMSTRF